MLVQTTLYSGLLDVLVTHFLVTMVKTSLLPKHAAVFSLGITLSIKVIVTWIPLVAVSSFLGL